MDRNSFKAKADVISTLLAAFAEAGNVDPVARAKAYMVATEDLTVRSLADATGRFIRGEVDGVNPAFCPSTAQLCQTARRIECSLVFVERRNAEAKQKPEPVTLEIAPPVKSVAERAAMSARLEEKFPILRKM